MRYYIKTFGCQQNEADSERIDGAFTARGMNRATGYEDASYVVINTCMIRESAENRVYGLINNLSKIKREKEKKGEFFKIIVTGCMVGLANRDKSGKYFDKIRRVLPAVDEFMPIEEIGFDNEPVRVSSTIAWVPISNGCNNFCTFCVVPYTRGREISREFHSVLEECKRLKDAGYTEVTLVGQNVNSYGADLLLGDKNIQSIRDLDDNLYFGKSSLAHPRMKIEYKINGVPIEPVYVKHLGRYRIPTLFPYLLEAVARLGFEKVDFVSSNPWDFSDALIDVIAQNDNITRTIHLPVQSGDDAVLRRMNRWYTSSEYLSLINKIKSKVKGARFTTDIIVGFCGETEKEFANTYKLAQTVGFEKAYVAMYSVRPATAATQVMHDNVPHTIKKKRWEALDTLINTAHLTRDKNSATIN